MGALSILGISNLLKCICSGRCVVVSHCDSNFMFINNYSSNEHIYICLLASLFCERSVQDTFLFLKDCLFFSY